MSRLRDNERLRGDILELVHQRDQGVARAPWASLTSRKDHVTAILDAVDRHLTQAGPAAKASAGFCPTCEGPPPDATPPPVGHRAVECTGLAAVWCPACGDCVCVRGVGLRPLDDPKCPLHRPGSAHAEPVAPAGHRAALLAADVLATPCPNDRCRAVAGAMCFEGRGVICMVRLRAYQAGHRGTPRAIECTGITAKWCPVCGDCTCPGEDLDDHGCPLHSTASLHGERAPLPPGSAARIHPSIRPAATATGDPDECRICDSDAEDCDVRGTCWGAKVRATSVAP